MHSKQTCPYCMLPVLRLIIDGRHFPNAEKQSFACPNQKLRGRRSDFKRPYRGE